MLVIPRINREFMVYMRQHYNHLTNDHFGQTVVDPEVGEGRAPPRSLPAHSCPCDLGVDE